MEQDTFADEILTELDDVPLGEELDIEILPMAPSKEIVPMSIVELPTAIVIEPTTTTSPVPTPIEVDQKKTSSSSLTCKYCEKKFRKENMLEAHERAHEGKKVDNQYLRLITSGV